MSSIHTQFGSNKIRNHILYLTPLIALEMLDKEGAAVDIVFYPPSTYVPSPEKSKKYHLLFMGSWEHLEWRGVTHSDTGALKVPLLAKMTKMPLVNPRLVESQTKLKSPQNITFHSFTSKPSFSEIFGNFDLELTPMGPKDPNFDLAIKIGWN